MKKHKQKILLGILVLIVVLDALLLWQALGMGASPNTLPDAGVPGQDSTAQIPPLETVTPATEPPEISGESTEPAGTEPSAEPTAPAGTEPPSTKPSAGPESLSFPLAIPNTELVIQQISAYTGIFWEDGTDTDIENVTTMLLTNTGSVGVEYASITLRRGAESLEFTVSALPAGASVVVQEKNRTVFTQEAYTACSAEVAPLETFELSENAVRIEETGDYSLSITNLTEEEIPCIRVFYKFYTSSEDVFIGGITYTSKIVNLAPGETTTITPSHYAKGYSRVVMVRIYDTDS